MSAPLDSWPPELQLYATIGALGLSSLRVSTNPQTGADLVDIDLDATTELRFTGPDLTIAVRIRVEGVKPCDASLTLMANGSPIATSTAGDDLVVETMRVGASRHALSLDVDHAGGRRSVLMGLATQSGSAGDIAIGPRYKLPEGSPPPCSSSSTLPVTTTTSRHTAAHDSVTRGRLGDSATRMDRSDH